MSKIIVIVPTYNEKDSIARLIDALEGEFKKVPAHSMGILIVDANSPDGTSAVVKSKMAEYRNVHLLKEREKRGLGVAYISGMNYAMRDLYADAFIEFDGDFQHDPKDIPRLVAAFDEGYDYVIGSRYVPGGSIPKEWAWNRKLISKFGSLYIRWVLGVPTNDNTSGFKLSRVKNFAERLPLSEDKILSKSFAYKIHLLYAMYKLGARIKEIPIHFLERKGGSSKSTLLDIYESLRVVLKLYLL